MQMNASKCFEVPRETDPGQEPSANRTVVIVPPKGPWDEQTLVSPYSPPEVSDEQVNRHPIREAAMVDSAPCLRVKSIDGTALVTFPRTDGSEGAARAVGGQLSKLAERPGCRRFVLDLRLARCLSSSMFGKLIAFRKKVQQRGGELTLCSPSPEVAAQFKRMGLDRLFHICSTAEEALGEIPRANAS
jgi:anti-anti-sigma factor